MKILILNGPNLNLLGTRQKDIYGEQTMEEVFGHMKTAMPNHQLFYFQSNHEGSIIDKLHEVGFDYDGIVLNAGAYTHTSIAIADAISSISSPVVEVHISDIYQRESFRHVSFLKNVCEYHVIGKGVEGYMLAVEYLVNKYQN